MLHGLICAEDGVDTGGACHYTIGGIYSQDIIEFFHH